MNRLRAALTLSRETRKAWGRLLLLSAILFIIMAWYANSLEVQGIYDQAEIRIGLLIELMGTFLTFLAIFLNWDLPRIQDQEQSEHNTQTALAKTQETLEEIKSLLASQQNQPSTTPSAPVIISTTPPALSRTALLLIATILSAILIIFLRRTP